MDKGTDETAGGEGDDPASTEGRRRSDGEGPAADRAAGGPDLTAVALLAGGMACFGSATPVSQIVGRSFPVWLGSGLRMAVAAAVLVPAAVVVARRKGSRVTDELGTASGRDRWLLAGIAAIGTFGFTVLMLLGMREAPGSVAAVVMATTPAVTAVGAVAFLGEHLTWTRIAAVALALSGVVLVNVGADAVAGAGDDLLLGSALIFGAVACEASYSLMGKRLTAELSPLVIATAAAVAALLLFLPLATWDAAAFSWGRPTWTEWTAVAWWGAGTMGLGSWLWFRGMARVAAGTAAAFMGVMPISALVLSYVLLGESFQWVHAAGMALVLAGLFVVVRSGASVH